MRRKEAKTATTVINCPQNIMSYEGSYGLKNITEAFGMGLKTE